MKIIGICGLIGSGKSTCVDILEKKGYKQVSFADVLKDLVDIIFRHDRTTRKLVQVIGTNIMQNHLPPDIWINFEKKMKDNKYGNKVVITDVRFPNECNMIHELGGIIIKIKRGEDPDWTKLITPDIVNQEEHLLTNLPHKSEWGWFGSEDIEIKNNSTIKDLESQLINFLENI